MHNSDGREVRTPDDVLEILAAKVETLSISLPLEADLHRAELFVKSRRTLEELERRADPRGAGAQDGDVRQPGAHRRNGRRRLQPS